MSMTAEPCASMIVLKIASVKSSTSGSSMSPSTTRRGRCGRSCRWNDPSRDPSTSSVGRGKCLVVVCSTSMRQVSAHGGPTISNSFAMWRPEMPGSSRRSAGAGRRRVGVLDDQLLHADGACEVTDHPGRVALRLGPEVALRGGAFDATQGDALNASFRGGRVAEDPAHPIEDAAVATVDVTQLRVEPG